MSKIVKCPICNNTTDISKTSYCSYCAQRLKKDSQDTRWNTTNNPKSKKSGCGCFTLLVIIIFMFLFSGYIKDELNYLGISTRLEGIKDSVVSTMSESFNVKESDKTSEADKVNTTNKIEEVNKISQGTKLSKLSDATTNNSMMQYNVKFSDGTRWVWFQVSKDNEVSDQVFPVDNGVFKSNIYLYFGPGKYNVRVLTSSSSERHDYFYEIKNYVINNEDKRDMRYLLPSEYVESDSEEIIQLANEITKNSNSDMKKTRAIHDWVCKNIAYDVEALNSGNVRIYGAIDTLSGKKAVCNGYANLTAALNRAVGIKTKIIHGQAKNENSGEYIGHAWNEVYIDDRWITQDTTWDAGGVTRNGKFMFQLDHKYFDPDPKVFKKTHVKEEEVGG